MKVSICVLCYGDYSDLAYRCLNSIKAALTADGGAVHDIRIGLNAVSVDTARIVDDFAKIYARMGKEVRLYVPRPVERNVCKYPLMRRMLWDETAQLASYVMWFDDDSYLAVAPDDAAAWWNGVVTAASSCDMLGQLWYMPVRGNQWEWIKTLSWYNPSLAEPLSYKPDGSGPRVMRFCQGAWWVARTDMLRQLNWPIQELRHNGGDSLLGEACRHVGFKLREFYEGVRINADRLGQHSKQKRRGHSESNIGVHYDGQPLPIDHQDFELDVIVFPPTFTYSCDQLKPEAKC